MKYAEINKRFTEIANEYLQSGYTFNTATMRGSQGEIAHLDLTDGTKVIRIVLQSFTEYGIGGIEGLEIIVSECTDDRVTPNSGDDWATIWNNHLAVIRTERFYTLGKVGRTGEPFFGAEAEAKRCEELRFQRYGNRDRARYQPDKTAEGATLEIARRVLQRKLNIKRLMNTEIKIRKISQGYMITYRGKQVAIH